MYKNDLSLIHAKKKKDESADCRLADKSAAQAGVTPYGEALNHG